ncbi:hypothetical protein LADH09A_003377 [Micromonospora sp. LAH09]|uniref:hypothetical protein n=1 Tax=Micromonospora cabrerizensis TaxID=2911213 RepID=UPI001EE8AD81|nr:hypothetical protein [Micromonospora cabrerizensis]MCG5469462.1 hypothetical protein [Micromonospora cabrerizensis]
MSDVSGLFALSNQFNTAADAGIGPVREVQIRERLFLDLLFTEEIYVPATSLLCNPATRGLLLSPGAARIASRRIVPVLTSDTSTFTELADKLQAIRSAAIPTGGQSVADIRRAAADLDLLYDRHATVGVDADLVDAAKNEISEHLIEDLQSIVKLPAHFHGAIIESAARQLDATGTIPGTWWNGIPREMPQLKLFGTRIAELGTIVFDFAYARTLASPLLGHSYGHDLTQIGRTVTPIGATCRLETTLEPLESREIQANALSLDTRQSITAANFERLLMAGQRERVRYFEAMRRFRAHPTSSTLGEAKERLEEYVVSLSRHVDSGEFGRFASRHRTLRYRRSQVVALRRANTVLYALAVAGAWNDVVRDLLTETPFGLVIVAGIATTGAAIGHKGNELADRLEGRNRAESAELARARPATLHVIAPEA